MIIWGKYSTVLRKYLLIYLATLAMGINGIMAPVSFSCACSEEVEKGKQLVEAAAKGDHEKLLELLNSGASVDADEYNKSLFYASKNYVTPLQTASANGNLNCVMSLLERGANVNARDRFDVTAAHMAAEAGHCECLKALLDHGADSSAPTKYSKKGCYTAFPHLGGTTPLHLAAANNHNACVMELIQAGADYNAVDERGRTSLYIAAQEGYEECILVHLHNALGRQILSLPEKSTGNTPLHFCIKYGLLECVSELLDHGSDVNEANAKGFTPLHCAVIEKVDKEILKLLICKGYNADINVTDSDGFTPLHYVAFSNGGRLFRRPELAAFLIAYGANINIRNQRGQNIIQCEFRSKSNNWAILKAIIKSMQHVPRLSSLHIHPPHSMSWNDIGYNMGAREHWLPLRNQQASQNSYKTILAKYQWYSEIAASPRSLQHYCRYTIRTTLGYRRLRHVKDLPIPTTLQKYLLLEFDEYK